MIIIEAKNWNNLVTELKALGDKLQGLDMEIEFRSESDHAAYPEFGTYKMAAQPYFYDNFERGAQRIEQALQSPDPSPQKIEQAAESILNDMITDAPVDTGDLQSKISMRKR